MLKNTNMGNFNGPWIDKILELLNNRYLKIVKQSQRNQVENIFYKGYHFLYTYNDVKTHTDMRYPKYTYLYILQNPSNAIIWHSQHGDIEAGKGDILELNTHYRHNLSNVKNDKWIAAVIESSERIHLDDVFRRFLMSNKSVLNLYIKHIKH